MSVKEVVVVEQSSRKSRKRARQRARKQKSVSVQILPTNSNYSGQSAGKEVVVASARSTARAMTRAQRRSISSNSSAFVRQRAGASGVGGNESSQGMMGRAISSQVLSRSLPPLTEEYSHIQGAIVAPQIIPPERYSTEYASKPSALANPWTIEDYPWSSSVNPNFAPPLGATELMVAVFRDPIRNHIFFDQNGAGAQSSYAARFTPQESHSAVPLVNLTLGSRAVFDDDLEIPYWVASNPYQPHGPTLYAGTDEHSERTYRWFDENEVLGISALLGGSTTWGLTVSLDQFKEDAILEDAVVGSGSGTSTTPLVLTTITEGGYYSIHVFLTLGAAQTIEFSASAVTSGSVFCHRPIPGFQTNQLAVDGIRVTGVSCMYTNNAALIQKAGTITGYQVPKETDWTQFIGPLSLLSRLNDSRTIDIQNGMYGFLKPTETEDFDLQEVFAVDPVSGVLTSSYFSLRNVKSYLMLRGTIVPPDGRSGYLTIANSVEYLTTDVWRPVDIARTDPDIYKKAMQELKHIDQWHENPTHVKELFKSILSGALTVGRTVQKYLPQAITIGEILGQMFLA